MASRNLLKPAMRSECAIISTQKNGTKIPKMRIFFARLYCDILALTRPSLNFFVSALWDSNQHYENNVRGSRAKNSPRQSHPGPDQQIASLPPPRFFVQMWNALSGFGFRIVRAFRFRFSLTGPQRCKAGVLFTRRHGVCCVLLPSGSSSHGRERGKATVCPLRIATMETKMCNQCTF